LLRHEDLKAKLHEADAFLVVMSFEEQLRVMMKTSFTTKFLEYCQYAKPVVIWGPDYCQPIKVAAEMGAGVTVTKDSEGDVVKVLESLRQPARWLQLAKGAWQAATGIFDHYSIHSVFKNSIEGMLETRKSKGGFCLNH
jgi:hypothetical protein